MTKYLLEDYNKIMFGFYDSYFILFGLRITYYGLIIASAMALGVFVACKNAKFRNFKSDDILVLACYILPLAIIGARIYYVIFSNNSYSFGEVFKIWDGGMAILGGVIGGAIGAVIYCLIHKKNLLDVGDIAAPSLILGQAIGRIGCYFAGCCYGVEVTDPALQWFPLSTLIGGHWHYSTFFYESIWNFCGFVVLLLLLRMNKARNRGEVIALYFLIYGAGRAWIEGMRGDSLYIGSLRVSQVLSIILVIIAIAMIVIIEVLQKKGKINSLYQLQTVYSNNLLAELENQKHVRREKRKSRMLERARKKELKKQKKSQDTFNKK